jgi:hypothetical protein
VGGRHEACRDLNQGQHFESSSTPALSHVPYLCLALMFGVGEANNFADELLKVIDDESAKKADWLHQALITNLLHPLRSFFSE